MTIKIPTSTFLSLTSEIADWLMIEELGDEKYKTMLIKTEDEERYTDEGQDNFNDKFDDVEQFLLGYFEKED
tara:strand:- start:164 stop:379 length:216 start_codon:yes stop_codon:yes gene_type:complete